MFEKSGTKYKYNFVPEIQFEFTLLLDRNAEFFKSKLSHQKVFWAMHT